VSSDVLFDPGQYRHAPDLANVCRSLIVESQIGSAIMASDVYSNHGVIILWWDESGINGVAGHNPNDINHTIGELVISDARAPM
jgi:hypothetical protein